MKIQIHFPWGIYKKLSNDNKVQFWAITSSCFVAIFTFFIGLTYQYLVLDESKEENRWSQHTQFVDNMSPVLKQRRSFENFSYMCSNQVNRAEKQLKQIQNSNTLNNSLMSNQTSNTHTLLKNLNTLADTIYSFSKDLYQVIDIPKYYMYDNLRDSVIQQQDALELHIKTFEILNYLLKNKNLNREELAMQLEEVISFPATLEDKLNDVLNNVSSMKIK